MISNGPHKDPKKHVIEIILYILVLYINLGVSAKGDTVSHGVSMVRSQRIRMSLHAEMAALLTVSKKEKIDLCVFSFKPDGTLKNSRPCYHFLKSMQKWNIKYVYYSNEYGGITKDTMKNLLAHPELNLITLGERLRKK